MTALWSVASVATAMWALAWALGLPMQTLTPDVINTYAWSVDSVRAFLSSLVGSPLRSPWERYSPRR